MKLQTISGLWLSGLLFTGAVFAEPVAMVTDVSGGVSTLDNGKPRKVVLLSYIEPGMVIQLNLNSHLTVTYFSKSEEYQFTGPAKLTVSQDQISSGNGKAETHTVSLQKTSSAKKFTVAQRENVAQAAFEMRSGGRPGLRLDDPVDTSIVDVDTLKFTWDGPLPKNGYQLSLYDDHNQLLKQEPLSANFWAPPAGLLKSGSAYEWEIRAALENGEVLTARGNFYVADNETAQSIQAQSPQAGSFSDRVLYAVFLEEKGFKYDARRLWEKLAKEHPDDLVAKEHSTR